MTERATLPDRLKALLPADIDGLNIRQHGNFHLGQALIVRDDIFIVGFEEASVIEAIHAAVDLPLVIGSGAAPGDRKRLQAAGVRIMLQGHQPIADTSIHRCGFCSAPFESGAGSTGFGSTGFGSSFLDSG